MFIGDQDAIDKLMKLSSDIMRLSRNSLIVNLRFMDSAVSHLRLQPESVDLAVDGRYLYYDPVHFLRIYKQEKTIPTRHYLHAVFHCVFQHFYINTLMDQKCWNLACDIAVENIINELHLSCVETKYVKDEAKIINKLRGQVKYLTAETLYRYFLDGNVLEDEMERMQAIFQADIHDIWYIPGGNSSESLESNSDSQGDNDKSKSNSGNGSNQNTTPNNNFDDAGDGSHGQNESNSQNETNSKQEGNKSQSDSSTRQQLKTEWKNISEQMQTDLETFSQQWGDESAGLTQNLKEVNREKYDYSEFLKKFAVMGESMKVNDDEFDYIFYTYGLQLYKKMPLIEPLEYKDVKKVKEFVIAIDTSGSTSGELVQKFLQKTYNILLQQENFFTKINVHIIQCDTEIHEDYRITSQEEFLDYMKKMEIKGLGGTDFRPVFRYVDKLIEAGEFHNLKGLIYFTDGFGTFPKKQPDYRTAVIYLDEGFNNPEVPAWAIKLVLKAEEV